MPYLTSDELRDRVGGVENLRKLTDDDEDGAPDATVLTLFLSGLDDEINFYLFAGGYDPGLLTASAISGMKRPMLDIANYRLRTRASRLPSEGDLALYEKAVEFFKAIGKRDGMLISVVSTGASAVPVLESDPVLFSRESLRGF
jgi:phage gp36-like protein